MLAKKTLFLMVLVGYMSSVQAGEINYYPRPESVNDPRTEYPVMLLNLAMQNSVVQYEFIPSNKVMNQGRALVEVKNNSGEVHIIWSMTSKEREQQLLPIRIPIYKGLIGWRLPLVKTQDADQFKNIKGIDDMRCFEAGQGHDWPDNEILRSNGLKVLGTSNYGGMFKMLEMRRFQYFPRSVAEIWAELDVHAGQELVVDKYIALYYPAAFYYFVNKNNKKLADALTSGLEKAIADGSFEKLFLKYYDHIIKRSSLENRMIIELKNPLLPPKTPLERKELWYKPKRG